MTKPYDGAAMNTIIISGGASKDVQDGDQLKFIPNYLPPGNNDEALINSFDGDGNPRCSLVVGGPDSPQLVSIAPDQVTDVWRQV